MDRLNQVGIRANHLYLFGNIPYFRSPNTLVSDNLRVALFLARLIENPYNILAEKLTKISESANKPIELSIIGRQREQSGLEHIRQIPRTSISRFLSQENFQLNQYQRNCKILISDYPRIKRHSW